MAFKLIIIIGLAMVVDCGVIDGQTDRAHMHEGLEDLSTYEFGHGDHSPAEYHSHPRYEFSYDVKDELTGDIKSQHETRDGDVVRGSYTLIEPDGHRRIVEYTADDHNGFNAVVKREPPKNHQQYDPHEINNALHRL